MKWIVYIILPAFLVSCDLFSTRPAEDPNQTKSNFTPPTIEEDLITNIINSFADKNVDNYTRCFNLSITAKPFTFVPSSSAQVAYQGIWEDWNTESERQYFSSIITTLPNSRLIRLSLSIEQSSFSRLGDSTKYSSHYTISIPQINSEDLYYEGNVEFTMIRNSSQIWVIYYWKDNAIGDSPTWSDLKGAYVN